MRPLDPTSLAVLRTEKRSLRYQSKYKRCALAAYTVQQEMGSSSSTDLRAAYGVYLLDTRQVWAPRSRRCDVDRPRRPPERPWWLLSNLGMISFTRTELPLFSSYELSSNSRAPIDLTGQLAGPKLKPCHHSEFCRSIVD